MDIISTAAKTVDYWRYSAVAALFIAGLFWFGGCSGFDTKVNSSNSGELMTPDELTAEYRGTTKEIEQEWVEQEAIIQRAQSKLVQLQNKSDAIDSGYEFDIEAAAKEAEARDSLLGGVGGVLIERLPAETPFSTLFQLALAAGILGTGADAIRKNGVIQKNKIPTE